MAVDRSYKDWMFTKDNLIFYFTIGSIILCCVLYAVITIWYYVEPC